MQNEGILGDQIILSDFNCREPQLSAYSPVPDTDSKIETLCHILSHRNPTWLNWYLAHDSPRSIGELSRESVCKEPGLMFVRQASAAAELTGFVLMSLLTYVCLGGTFC